MVFPNIPVQLNHLNIANMISALDCGAKKASLFANKLQGAFLFQLRRRSKKTLPKITNIDRALEYFDVAYAPIYRGKWPSIRLALLSKQKYLSVLNNFSESAETIKTFQELGAVDIRDQYNKGVEQFKLKMARFKEYKKSLPEKENSSVHDLPETVRPSLIELDDDELAARTIKKEIERYPEEYRERSQNYLTPSEEGELEFANRMITAAHIGSEAALMMDYVPSTKLKGLEDWIEETDVFVEANVDGDNIGLKIELQEEPLVLPEMLKVYSFLKGDISDFPHPVTDYDLGVQDHYPLNGASLLPVLALDIKPGDEMLDLCSAPGGKALISLQTLLLKSLVCNDYSAGRLRRLNMVMKQYVPKGLSVIEDIVSLTTEDACELNLTDAYDKILVDVPCINDRLSLKESDNSIFNTRRTRERLRLPEIQSQILFNALKAIRPGGTVVYSTCTLSPLQNDGVVHLTLSRIWQETTIEYAVVDMKYAVQPLNFLFKFGSNLGLRYGQIVLPNLLNNFGPMYISKIKRLK